MRIRALLWKDCRLNRLLLTFGMMVLLGPFVLGVGNRVYCAWRFGYADWSFPFWVRMVLCSLGLSMFTIVMLGANAFAAERADRSAEFLAYLPPSRGAHVISKAIVVLSAAVLIWLVNLTTIYVVGPWAEARFMAEANPFDTSIHEVMRMFGATCVMLLGVTWLSSSFLSSHGLATAIGLASPVVIGLPLGLIEEYYHPVGFDLGMLYKTICVTVGVVGFAGGIVCYLRRVEP